LGISTGNVTVAVAFVGDTYHVTMNGSANEAAVNAVSELVKDLGGHAEIHMYQQYGHLGIDAIGVSNRTVCPACQTFFNENNFYEVYWDDTYR
jgi:hypothetical protein